MSVKGKWSGDNGDEEYNEEERGEKYREVKHCVFCVRVVLSEI
jgi:hypothetical protein